MGDCHSFDPGSKFGLERKTNKKKQQPNEHPGPGAAYTFFSISNSNHAKVEAAELLHDDTATLVLFLKDEKWAQQPSSPGSRPGVTMQSSNSFAFSSPSFHSPSSPPL